jgi:putative addiction module component (TIGR02574 family)
MSDKLDTVIEDALALPPVERARLVEVLYRSFQSDEERDIEHAWVEESERRISAYNRGEIEPVPYEEMKRHLDHS